MKNIDYIIVGQGIAGSLLAYQLMQSGKKVIVLNDEARPTSSAVAGGIFNPITGKNLDKTWLADKIFPYLRDFYTSLEKVLHTRFYHETNLYRPFANEQQRRHFLRLTDEYDLGNYLKVILPKSLDYKQISNELGGLYTSSAGWVNVPKMLAYLKIFFIKSESYQAENFDFTDLKFRQNRVLYKNLQANKIIFCEGFYATQNPLFAWVPFNPAKGETLLANIADYKVKEIINQGSWIIPLGEGNCRFGSTYVWDNLDWETSNNSHQLIVSKISKFLLSPYEIISQEAGIRPTTKDRRPFIGRHQQFHNAFIFNGFGTKGVSLAPYFSEEMLDFLETDKVLTPEINIERFYSLSSL